MSPAPATFDHEAALLACARGDRSALRRLYDVEARQMLGVALRIVRERALAEDIVQDAFIKVWDKAQSFDPLRGSARGWVYSIVRHGALNEVRDSGRQIPMDEAALEAIDLQRAREALPSTPELGTLDDCLGQLDTDKRSSIVLAYVEGCTHAEIAQRLATPLGTVKAWIRRGLAALRECMQ
ncbi:MAG: sigma-70 family RNA polymerase sigma factor [Pseudomonadota bacterium]